MPMRPVVKAIATSCMLAVGSAIASLPKAEHDRGGVSFDFAAISAERFPNRLPNVGKNLLQDGWNGIHTNDYRCVVALPHSRGGVYRIAARTKVWPVDRDVEIGETSFFIRVGTMTKGFTETPNRASKVREAKCWRPLNKRFGDWYVATKTFEALPGETHAHVSLKCKRAKIEVRDAVLCEEVAQPEDMEKKQEAPMTIATQFCSYIGGTFEVSEGQLGELAFVLTRPAGERFPVLKGEFAMTLPKGIEFVDATFAELGSASVMTNADGTTTARFRPRSTFSLRTEAYWWMSRHVLVRATGGVGKCGDGWLSYHFDDGKRSFSAESMRICFSIVPKIFGKQPKRVGFAAWHINSYNFADVSSAEMLAKFHRDCGQNWIVVRAEKEYPLLKIWRDCGFSTITPHTGNWCVNGYCLGRGDGGDIPDDERFQRVRPIPARYEKNFKNAVCPSALAERTDYVRNVVMKRIAEYAHGVDGLEANWEPFMFKEAGCGCLRCGREFAKFIGRDWSEVSNMWPKCAFPGGELAKRGVEFRSHMHGKVVRTIDCAVRSVPGADKIGFMPGIHFGQMTSSWREHHPMPEASPVDYAEDTRWINVWGPYVPWRSSHPYPRERARHIAHFVCARDLRDQLVKDYPSAEKRPHIFTETQGTQGDYFTQPEMFEMSLDAYFFNGFEGCCPWGFPAGADARYWRAFANASRRAATYEAAVAEGRAADDRVSVETVPEFAAPIERIVKYVKKWRKVPQIFTVSYDFGGGRFVGVFNCWQKGEAFFTLKAAGLAPGRYTVSSHDGILWTKSGSAHSYTAEELAQGVFLSVGACRTRVFEIVPEGGKPCVEPKSEMTAERLRKAYEERRAALAVAAAQDAKDAEEDFGDITWCD